MKTWWPGTELNRRRQPFQGCALPPELPGHSENLRRATTLHPTSQRKQQQGLAAQREDAQQCETIGLYQSPAKPSTGRDAGGSRLSNDGLSESPGNKNHRAQDTRKENRGEFPNEFLPFLRTSPSALRRLHAVPATNPVAVTAAPSNQRSSSCAPPTA